MKTLAFCRVLWYNICMENRETQTSNTAEMVTISRAEYERFQEQAQVITSLTLQNEWLLEQLKLSKKKLFGRSSEQVEQMVMEQLSFTYNEAEAYVSGTKAAAEKPVAVKAHEESGARRAFPARLLGLAARGRIPGIPQAAGEHPGGGLLGTCAAKI